MAKKTKVKSLTNHDAAFRKALKSPELRKVVREQLELIQQKAGPGHEIEVADGPTRVRGTITTRSRAARQKESRDKNLTRAALESKR